jgi:hypothetical protein
MYSVTLQTSDNVITSGDKLGQLSFAASAESDGSAAILIAGSVYAQAEGGFQSASNPTSIVIATAAADASSAVDRLKVNEDGHLLPMVNDSYDLGAKDFGFSEIYASGGLVLGQYTPGDTTNKLYNEGGTLKFNGSAVGGGGGISNIVEDTTPQLGGNLDAQNHEISGVHAMELVSNTPAATTNMLYNDGTTLKFNGEIIPESDPITGASGIHNFMVMDQPRYDSITPDVNTIYFIV